MKTIGLILIFVCSVAFVEAQTQNVSTVDKSGVPVKITDLPKPIGLNMGVDHLGFAMKRAYKVKEGYRVHITNGTVNEVLLYDKNGTFLKTLESNAASIKKVKPATPPPVNSGLNYIPPAETEKKPVAKPKK